MLQFVLEYARAYPIIITCQITKYHWIQILNKEL